MDNILFAAGVNGILFLVWLILLYKNQKKACEALKVGLQTIFSMLPLILIIIGCIGIFTTFLTPANIAKFFGDQAGVGGILYVSIFSSLLQIPGMIAFPIAAMLYQNGAAVSIVAVFAGASTMASVFTLPLEIKYLGKKFALIRVGLTYIVCLIVGVMTGFIFHLIK
ncbi:MAG: permease [Patescibacteria group bacterium]|nr:permease [Patescibacteria group bacterium]